jgi:hypothetical protein
MPKKFIIIEIITSKIFDDDDAVLNRYYNEEYVKIFSAYAHT